MTLINGERIHRACICENLFHMPVANGSVVNSKHLYPVVRV